MRKNCWEIKECGREPGGNNIEELGICPAAEPSRFDGKNGGTNGGRYCWTLEGTLCANEIQGNWARKMGRCRQCEVFEMIQKEEGEDFSF